MVEMVYMTTGSDWYSTVAALTYYLQVYLNGLTWKEFFSDFLPWVISAITLWATYLQGQKRVYAWLVTMCVQALWTVWILLSSSWGLIPLNIGMWYLSWRNNKQWVSDDIAEVSNSRSRIGC